MKEIVNICNPKLEFDKEFDRYRVFFEPTFKEKYESISQNRNLESFIIECRLNNVNHPFVIETRKGFCAIILNFKQFPNKDEFVEVVSSVLDKVDL